MYYQVSVLCHNTGIRRRNFDKFTLNYLNNHLYYFLKYYFTEERILELKEFQYGDVFVELKTDKNLISELKKSNVLKGKNYISYHDKIWVLIHLFFNYIFCINHAQKILLENIIKVHQCIETPLFIKFFTKPFVLEYQGIPERLYERDYIVFGTSEDISYLLQALMSQINPRLILDQESQQLLHRFASLLIQSTFDYINSVDGITKENYVGYIEDYCEMVFPSNLSNFVRMDVRSSIEQDNDLYLDLHHMDELIIFNLYKFDVRPIKAIVEYILGEILNLSGQVAEGMQNKKITKEHIYLGVKYDEDLAKFPIFEDRDMILRFIHGW